MICRNPLLSSQRDILGHMSSELVVEAEASPVSGRRQLSALEQQTARLKGLESKLLEDSLEVVTSVCEFAELDPEKVTAPPQEWIDELGGKEAWKKYRMVMAGWLNSKEAPIGIQVATKVSIGIIRARASSKVAPQTLNITQIEMTVAPTQYPSILDVEDKNPRTG